MDPNSPRVWAGGLQSQQPRLYVGNGSSGRQRTIPKRSALANGWRWLAAHDSELHWQGLHWHAFSRCHRASRGGDTPSYSRFVLQDSKIGDAFTGASFTMALVTWNRRGYMFSASLAAATSIILSAARSIPAAQGHLFGGHRATYRGALVLYKLQEPDGSPTPRRHPIGGQPDVQAAAVLKMGSVPGEY
jgi:hypothetical protein